MPPHWISPCLPISIWRRQGSFMQFVVLQPRRSASAGPRRRCGGVTRRPQIQADGKSARFRRAGDARSPRGRGDLVSPATSEIWRSIETLISRHRHRAVPPLAPPNPWPTITVNAGRSFVVRHDLGTNVPPDGFGGGPICTCIGGPARVSPDPAPRQGRGPCSSSPNTAQNRSDGLEALTQWGGQEQHGGPDEKYRERSWRGHREGNV